MPASTAGSATSSYACWTNARTLAWSCAYPTRMSRSTGWPATRWKTRERSESRSAAAKAWSTAPSTSARVPSAAGVTCQEYPAAVTTRSPASEVSARAVTARMAWSRVMPPTAMPSTLTPGRILVRLERSYPYAAKAVPAPSRTAMRTARSPIHQARPNIFLECLPCAITSVPFPQYRPVVLPYEAARRPRSSPPRSSYGCIPRGSRRYPCLWDRHSQ